MDDDKITNESAERPRIKVTDRRKFSADGTLRPPEEASAAGKTETDEAPEQAAAVDAVEKERESAAPAEDPADAEAAAPAAAETEAPGPAAAGEPEEEPRIAGTEPSIAQLPRDFGAFVESMYLEAMLYMGAIADPRTGQTIEDIDLAKYKIDVLIMLQEKTEGNLTDDEQRQLEEVLYQLRMLYLQKSKAAKL